MQISALQYTAPRGFEGKKPQVIRPKVPVGNNINNIINRERTTRGLSVLKINGQIEHAALLHSQDMLAHNNLTHDTSDGSKMWDRLSREGYHYTWCGEIIALYPGGTDEAVVRLWINSPPHYAIMFNTSAVEFGVGIAGGFYTVDFGAP